MNPGIEPNEFFPFISVLRDMGGGFLTAVIIVCAIALVISAGILAYAKISKSNNISDFGLNMVIWILVAAMIAGSASGMIAFFANIRLF